MNSNSIEHSLLVHWMYRHPVLFWLILLFTIVLLQQVFKTLSSSPIEPPQISIHEVARLGDLEGLKVVLQKKINIDSRDDCQWTALMRAAQNSHVKASLLLLSEGADVNAVDKGGYSVLTITSIYNNPEVIQHLINNGAKVNYQDPEMGWSALHWSAKEGHLDNVIVLLC